jgi:hypothetical protein
MKKKKRTIVVTIVALALVGLAAPAAFAQSAPVPKVTITGLIDNVTSYGHNLSENDAIINGKKTDKGWASRTRGVFDFTGEVGQVKGVFSLEMDFVYGQAGAANSQLGSTAGTTPAGIASENGTQCGSSLNIDVRGCLKVKWLYSEFPLPFVPVPTVARLGLQPFGTDATYKLATYAQGEFAGVNLFSQITPNLKMLLTYVQVESNLYGTGTQTGMPFNPNTQALAGSSTSQSQNRGNEWAMIGAPEITVMKGLDIKPMFSTFYASGTTSSSARVGRGGIGTGAEFQGCSAGGAAGTCAAAGISRGGLNENRNTVGVDGRYRMGPFSLDPSFLYQFGSRDAVLNSSLAVSNPVQFAQLVNAGVIPDRVNHAKISAFLMDLRAGYQLGPLLIEGLGVYSSGNTSRSTTLQKVHYYQPLDTDTAYLADWGSQLSSLGLDYDNTFNEAAQRVAYPGNVIGWDKYGRAQVGLKATYSFTPTLSVMAGASGHWTAQSIDKNGVPVTGIGLLPSWNGCPSSLTGGGCVAGNNKESKSSFIGTELQAVVSWKFVPGISWDNGAGVLFPGQALTNLMTDPTQGPRNSKDIWIYTSRVRFTF